MPDCSAAGQLEAVPAPRSGCRIEDAEVAALKKTLSGVAYGSSTPGPRAKTPQFAVDVSAVLVPCS
jgi:hypothetical protein